MAIKNVTNPQVEKYIYGILPRRDPVLSEMEAYAKKHDVPIVGPAVGRMLALLVELIGARRIFEMGSAIGYSTLWMARAAGIGAEVFYSDGDPANAKRAQDSFIRADVASSIHVQVGDALELLDRTPGEFDLIFCDVDKHQYPDVFHKAVPRIRSGGLFIADNTLWSGRVTRKPKASDRNTRGIIEFNKLCYASKELFPVLVPLRDGVLVCRKR
ncbi:MAG TPA: O-methyltransferase [Candidatus Acidoferrales bacterium]|jgi:predicted O-methyltransferase YrrM|nr:O-methyltransferase [Candidatus Acidoferrales bacterium]